jgi:threonine dehydratase
MPLFTLDELAAAHAVVGRHVPRTPSYAWPLLASRFGAEIVVKHENHTPTGAFKVRGGLVYLDRLVRERPGVPGVISATRGNHGQSLAFAGRAAGKRVVIVVPEGNSPAKNAAMRAFGAELIVHGADFQEAREHAGTLASELGLEMVPPFHRDLVLGVATYAKEFFEDAAPLDVVYVPVGMGSGICGLITVRDLLGLPTEIVGVVAERAPATALSFAAGHPVNTPGAATFVDGVATRSPDPAAIDIICHGAARIVAVSEDAAAEAMRVLGDASRQLVEPAGALGIAALLTEGVRGRRIGVVQSGGNADVDQLISVWQGVTPTG